MSKKNIPVILLAFADEPHTPNRRLQRLSYERDQVVEALKMAEHDQLCQVVVVYDANLKKIRDQFNNPRLKGRIAIFHFSGHANEYSLQLEEPYREEKHVYADGFAQYLGLQNSLQLVFLNACTTQKQAVLLHQAGIPTVISTDTPVDDETARALAVHFYQALGADKSIENAYQEAANLMHAKENIHRTRGAFLRENITTESKSSWQYSHHPDKPKAGQWTLAIAANNPLAFLPKIPKNEIPNPPFPALAPYTTAYTAVFGGRSMNIRNLYTQLTKKENYKPIIFYGSEGVGKTSLLCAGIIPRLEQNYSVTYLVATDKKFKKKLQETLQTTTTNKHFIILDALTTIDDYITKTIIDTQGSNNRFLISIPSRCRLEWEAGLISSEVFYLAPLSLKEIKDSLKRIHQTQLVKMDDEFLDTFAALLATDKQAPIAPLLQWCLIRLWEGTKIQKNDKPHWSWHHFQQLYNANLMENFITQQLEKVNKTTYTNSLLLNILKDCLDLKEETLNHIKILQLKYAHLPKPITSYILLLKKHYLLASPTDDRQISLQQIKISHNLLREPILQILSLSNYEGLQARRLVEQTHQKDSFFDKTAVTLITKNLNAMPKLEAKMQNKYNISKQNIQTRINNQYAKRIIQISISAMILYSGFIVQNPYLLLFTILCIVLYK